jgi:hypothetical protein
LGRQPVDGLERRESEFFRSSDSVLDFEDAES